MSKTEGLQTASLGDTASQLNKSIFASIQGKFRQEQPAFLNIYKVTKRDNTSDLISVDEFSRIYKSLWIHLDTVELDFIKSQYASGIEGKLHWTKFVNRLNILPPPDHHEPDRFLDPLPEPLAGIVEILELDILDRAWLDIIQLHPEIPIDDEGKSLVVRRNRNLEVLCPPSTTNKLSTLPTSMSSDGSFLFSSCEDGSVVMISSRSGEEKHTLPVFRELVRGRNQPHSVIFLSNAVSVPSALGVPVSRLAVCVMYESTKPVDESESAAAPAKKAAKGKGAVVEEALKPPEREFTLHIKLVESVESDSGNRSVGIKVLSDELACTVTAMNVTVDLCSDGKLLTICHTNQCSVYYVSEKAPVEAVVGGPGLAQVPEEKPSSLVDEVPTFELLLLSNIFTSDLNQNKTNESTGESSEIPSASVSTNNFQKCYSFLLPESAPDAVPRKDLKATEPAKIDALDPANVMKSYALVVLMDSSPNLVTLGFSPLLPDVITPPAATDKKGAASAPPAEAPNSGSKGALSTFIMNSWRLTGPVTASVLDKTRRMLGLGTADGSVSLWDLPHRLLVSACGKHSSHIDSLCFSEGLANYFICSGAADGTVCFYKIRCAQSTGAARAQGIFEPATVLVDVRQDVPKAAVTALYSLAETSIVISVFNDSTIAVYEAETGYLLGKLVLYVGMLAQKMVSRPVPVFDVMQTVRTKHKLWLANSLPSADDGEMSDAGAPTQPSNEEEAGANSNDEVNIVEEFFSLARSQVFGGIDQNGLCILFSDGPKESSASEQSTETDIVRAMYSTNSIIEYVCPGVAALTKGGVGNRIDSAIPSASVLYRMLSPGERINPHISNASIQYVDAAPTTASTVVEDVKKKKKKKTSALTTENLNAHDNRDLIYKAPAPRLGAVLAGKGLSSSSLGSSLLRDLRQRPDAQVHQKKVSNRLRQLSNILPAS